MALERETVVRAALILLNDVGFDGLTVRRLAEQLGVQNPALYWHFRNKQDLLDEMAETLLADAFAGLEPPATPDQWTDWLAGVAERFHSTLLAHRDGARIIAAANLRASALVGIQERALAVMTMAGFDLCAALNGIVAIFDYTLGAAFEEQSEPNHPNWGHASRFESRRPSLDPECFPLLATACDELTTAAHPAVGFTGGLQLLLAGMVATKKAPAP